MRLVVRTFASAMWVAAVGVARSGSAMAKRRGAPRRVRRGCCSDRGGRRRAQPAAPPKVRSKTPDPRMIPVLLAQGRACLAAEAFKPARDAYMDVLTIDPKNAAAQADLGYTYLRMEDFPRATKALSRDTGPAAVAVDGAQRFGRVDPHK